MGDAGQEQVEPTVLVTSAEAPSAPEDAGPFRRLDSEEPARIVLRQLDPTDFALVEGFRYDGAAGAWTVRPEDLPHTDLASIPRFLGWFVSRYGKHTLAALLHDHLVRNGEQLDPPVPRHRADDAFRIALDELGVPYARARIMWAAVTFATRWRSSLAARLALAVWMVAAVAGIAALVWGLATGRWLLAGAAALGPIPFAALWGRREYLAGVVGGYTLWLVAPPALVNILAYAAYEAAERVVRRVRAARSPARVEDLPPPPPYTAR